MRLLPSCFAACLLLLCLGPGCGASLPPPPPPTGSTAAAELRDYAQFIRDVHPAPWRFLDAASFDARVAAEAAALEELAAPTSLEVARAFQRVIAGLGDAHLLITAVPPPPGTPRFLPLLIKDLDGELVIDAASDAALVGASIVSIDGRPADELHRTLLGMASGDGVNEVARRRWLERYFTRLYPLAYGVAPWYHVRLRRGDAEEERVLAGIDGAELRALVPTRRSAPVWGAAAPVADRPFLPVPLPGVTWLRLESFATPDSDAYRTALDAILAAADHSTTLVIDVRGNEGGNAYCGIALLNHLLARPYQQFTRATVRVRELPARYRGRATAAFGTSLDYLRAFPATPRDGEYVFEGDRLARVMVPSEAWSGRVLVLVDGLTGSAANDMTVALKHARPDALLVGEEVGGGCAEHIGDLPLAWTTPTFGISLVMSMVRLEFVPVPGCVFGHGLVPDVAVSYTRDDFDAGRDPYVEAVRRLASAANAPLAAPPF